MRRINAAEQRHFNKGAKTSHDQGRQNNPAPKSEIAGEPLGQRKTHISAKHVKGAVGKIDDTGDAENDRQAASGKKQRRSARQAGDEDVEEKCHRPDPGVRRELADTAPVRSILRAQRLDLAFRRKIFRAIAIHYVRHLAFAVLQRGLADEGAKR